MKKTLLFILFAISATCLLHAQDQTVNGFLSVTKNATIMQNLFVGDWNVAGKTGYGSKLFLAGNDFHTDELWLSKFVKGEGVSELRINIGDDTNQDRLSIGNIKWNANGAWTDWFVVSELGVGIKTSTPNYTLDVNGTIHAKEVKIDNNGWADFVFDKGYKLPTLAEVEAHIQEHKRLPEIPSEAEVKENGVDVGEMQVKLLQKVEELTLYVIQQQKELEEVKKENQELRELINNK
ncbi:hypothetical protein [Dysgonomonas sp. 25]|uniref:hypothetical protein n=1 Tax=Dysgonomonas sp. 25 TaxID=2302933 RepID=UPI0013D654D1|nr:hypothetical protein [Dysgonomonas sp. 25]NDV69239.1 hypothetical protein [Dysgonomonas sp. 25]